MKLNLHDKKLVAIFCQREVQIQKPKKKNLHIHHISLNGNKIIINTNEDMVNSYRVHTDVNVLIYMLFQIEDFIAKKNIIRLLIYNLLVKSVRAASYNFKVNS